MDGHRQTRLGGEVIIGQRVAISGYLEAGRPNIKMGKDAAEEVDLASQISSTNQRLASPRQLSHLPPCLRYFTSPP